MVTGLGLVLLTEGWGGWLREWIGHWKAFGRCSGYSKHVVCYLEARETESGKGPGAQKRCQDFFGIGQTDLCPKQRWGGQPATPTTTHW